MMGEVSLETLPKNIMIQDMINSKNNMNITELTNTNIFKIIKEQYRASLFKLETHILLSCILHLCLTHNIEKSTHKRARNLSILPYINENVPVCMAFNGSCPLGMYIHLQDFVTSRRARNNTNM